MTIPDPLTPITITAGIITNIASDILKHYSSRLEDTLAGKILKHTGLIPKSLLDQLSETINQTLKILFERYPEYRITGFIEFIKDPRISEQLLSFLLDRKSIDNERIQQIFLDEFQSDPYTKIILSRRGLDAQQIIQAFTVCYRESLLKHADMPQVLILFEIFTQSDTLVKEIRASEDRLRDYVHKLFKESVAAQLIPTESLWEGFIAQCESKLDLEIRSSVGKKYIPGLYVSREIEGNYDEFANKSSWERKSTTNTIQADIQKLEDEELATLNLITNIDQNISQTDNDIRIIKSFLFEKTTNTPDELWRNLNSLVDFLNTEDKSSKTIKEMLDRIGDALTAAENELTRQQQTGSPSREKSLDEFFQELLELSDQIKSKLKQQGILEALSVNKESKVDEKSTLRTRASDIRSIKNLIEMLHDRFINASGQKSFLEIEQYCTAIDDILGRKTYLVSDLGYLLITIEKIRRHYKNTFLVIDRAGSGKTNLLCHLAKKYCKSQATIFISGKILLDNEFNIEDYIVKTLCSPEIGVNFGNFEHITQFLESFSDGINERKLLVFIDGINENTNVALIKRAIQRLLINSKSKNIYICISCRDIFWDYFDDEFWMDSVYEFAKNQLYNFTLQEFEVALNLYFSYYHINCQIVGEALEKCKQPLLLRFFCEAYGDSTAELVNIGEVPDIRLKKLFDDYWNRKITNTKAVLGYRTSRDIEKFLFSIANYMRRNQTRNIPQRDLESITKLSDLDTDKSVYVRILDEDIIIELGSSPTSDVWVTFVYDEFMEYTIAKEIFSSVPINSSWKAVVDIIESLIGNSRNFKSMEGVIGYLCIMFSTERKKPLWDILIDKGMPWVSIAMRAISQLSSSDMSLAEFKALEILSRNDDQVKIQVLLCMSRLQESSLYDFINIWKNLFLCSATRNGAADHLISLANRKREDALSVFLAAVNDSSDDKLCGFAIYSLARIKGINASTFSRVAHSGDEMLRQAVAYTLQYCTDGKPFLLSLLRDSSSDVRRQACFSLGAFQNFKSAESLLFVYAHDHDDSVRAAARNTISVILNNLGEKKSRYLHRRLQKIKNGGYMPSVDNSLNIMEKIYDLIYPTPVLDMESAHTYHPSNVFDLKELKFRDSDFTVSKTDILKPKSPGYYPTLRQEIQFAVGRLSLIEQNVLELSFGISGTYPYTNEDVASILKMSVRKVKVTRRKALRKLSKSNMLKLLSLYYG